MAAEVEVVEMTVTTHRWSVVCIEGEIPEKVVCSGCGEEFLVGPRNREVVVR